MRAILTKIEFDVDNMLGLAELSKHTNCCVETTATNTTCIRTNN